MYIEFFSQRLAITIGCLALVTSLSAQPPGRLDATALLLEQEVIGVNTSIPIQEYRLPEGYRYKVFVLAGYYRRPLLVSRRRTAVSLTLAPQINPVWYFPDSGASWEAGVNLGFEYRVRLGHFAPYLAIGVGPHYFPTRTARQARGFIFSDNFTAGFHYLVDYGAQPYFIHTEFTFRHLSNAEIRSPNAGVNNYLMTFGVSRVF